MSRYKLADKLVVGGWPVFTESGQHSRKYQKAHLKANAAEKEKFGNKKFQALNKLIRKNLPPNENAAHVNRKGQITVSRKIPKRFRKQAAYNDKMLYKFITGR